MFKSNLFRRMFLLALPVLALFSIGLYVSSIPLIKDTAFEIEQSAGRTILNNVYELTKRIHLNHEKQRELILDAHKRQLNNIVTLAVSFGEQSIQADMERGLGRQEALDQFFESLRDLKYGNLDYVWAADFNSFIVSHPDDQFHRKLAENITENVEKTVIERMVAVALEDQEGYMEYNWRRLGPDLKPSRKLSYFRLIPEWGIVIGTGVYIDDVTQELEQRLQESIAELRKGLHEVQIAKTGYIYIFDSEFNMIIHPSENIELQNFKDQKDPLTGKPIGELLVSVTNDQDGLVYKWDRPDDQNNYVYDKIAWVRHFEGFDWYIASSVYVDELKRSSTILGNHILTISVIGLILAIMLMSAFIRHLVTPIHEMATVAKKVQDGDLSAKSRVERDDELGLLSQAFNSMIRKMHENISSLDSKVHQRTLDLEKMNENLLLANKAKEETQNQLLISEERQRLILNAIPAYVGYFNTDKRLLFANKELQTLISPLYTKANYIEIDQVFPEFFFKQLSACFDRAYRGEFTLSESIGVFNQQDAHIRKNTFIPEFSASGDVKGLFFLSFDITEEKQVENQLREAERISAIGKLSGGLAHDFNNLLAVIIGNLSAACEKISSQNDVEEYIKPALRAGHRGADIANRLLAFSRNQPLVPRNIDLLSYIPETIKLLESSIAENITLTFKTVEEECKVFADENQLENALLNLALNAKDAMPDGGSITFKVWPWDNSEHSSFDEDLPERQFIAISITDSGDGFAQNVIEHAFEPFFTTKLNKGGNGLGLSMVYGFIKQSNGFVKIENNSDKGATITLLLPAATLHDDAVLFPDVGAISEDHESWQGKLALLVDDDEEVRATVRKQLLELGFTILEAANGDEAKDIIHAVDDIYILISDIIMPGELDGYQLALHSQSVRSDVHILLMTGYSPATAKSDLPHQNFKTVSKPFDHKNLEKALLEATHSPLRSNSSS